MAKEQQIGWDELRGHITKQVREKRGLVYRGQASAVWKLATSFTRHNNGLAFHEYFERLVPLLADHVSTIEKREIKIKTPEDVASFVAYLQHHGFPTPLMDWTYSPYIAAYFAYSEINDRRPQVDEVAIFEFDYRSWINDFEQIVDYRDPRKYVTGVRPNLMGNVRQMAQQGTYTFSNVDDMYEYIGNRSKEKKRQYLTKFVLSVKEKPYVMRDLESMGIHAFSLFQTVEGFCRYTREVIFGSEVGKTPTEHFNEFMAQLSQQQTTLQQATQLDLPVNRADQAQSIKKR